jgi:hypothetical protein
VSNYCSSAYKVIHYARMYIRWQSRKRKKAAFGRGKGDVHWSAILAESARVDGKPTQRHIAYLVGFNESAVAHPQQQLYLWERIAEQLTRLDQLLSPEDRENIKAALVKKIGKPPTKAQRAALDRQREQILGTL